jgi:hypothetical protein
MLKSISHGISAGVAQYQPELPHISPRMEVPRVDMGPRADIPCNVYYQAKIAEVNKDKILKYYTIIALGGGRYKNISTSEKHID